MPGRCWGRIRSYLSPAFPDGEYGGPRPVSGEPALRWVVPGCPGQSSAVGPGTALVAPLTFRRGRWPVPAPLSAGARACFPGCPGESVDRCCAHSALSNLAGHMRLGSRAQRTSLELPQSRTQVEAGQTSAGPAPSGVEPPKTPRVGPLPYCSAAFNVAQSSGGCLSPPGHSERSHAPGPCWERPGRGRAGGRAQAWGLPQEAEGLGGTGASKAGGGEGGKGRGQEDRARSLQRP